MITDTALFRYHHYHTPADTPDKVDYESLARVVSGLELAGLGEEPNGNRSLRLPVLTPSSAAPVTYVIWASNGAAIIAQP